MPIGLKSPLFRAGTALALLLVLAACTPGGQFDPVELFSSDMFDSKTKLKGQRIPVFPDGVPGATTGVPADLVKGYKEPADQPNADATLAGNPPPAASAQPEEKPKPKPKPKPRVAVARPPKSHAPIAPPSSTPTRIDVGATGAPAQQQPAPADWPNSPPAAQQAGQFAWPAPPAGATAPAAQPSQSAQPAPSANAPAPQGGRTFDSMWPNPPATGTPSQ